MIPAMFSQLLESVSSTVSMSVDLPLLSQRWKSSALTVPETGARLGRSFCNFTNLSGTQILFGSFEPHVGRQMPATEWNTNTAEWFKSLYFNTCFLQLLYFLYPLHNNLQGKLPSTTIQRLYSAQAQGEITFSLAYLLQLRLCFGELPYQLRIRFVPRSVPFGESEKHPCVQAMFFSHGNKQDS